MIIITKEIRYEDDLWCQIGTIRTKDESLIKLLENGYKPATDKDFSKVTQTEITFFNPDTVFALEGREIQRISGSVKGFNKLVGCWPFDFINVVGCTEDMLMLRRDFGIVDFRLVVYRE